MTTLFLFFLFLFPVSTFAQSHHIQHTNQIFVDFSPTQTSTSETVTKHIFIGNLLVATIEGSGPEASVHFIHTDHLGGSNIVTDSEGNVEEVSDYYPYGKIRIDETTGSFNEERKFTGHEYDQETELNYMGARYQNGAIGKFTSQDPASRDVPEQFLLDPQQLNTYSYARNNPLVLVDPTGEKVELFTRPINHPALGKIGAHAFLAITPEDPRSVGWIPGVNTSKTFTLGGYAGEFPQGTLVKGANGDLVYTNGGEGISSVVVSHPKGVSQADFEKNIVKYYNSLPNEVESYHFLGYPHITGDPNSNNFATSLLVESGVKKSQVNSYQRQLFFDTHRVAPGLGTPFNTPSIQESVQTKLTSIITQLNRALNKLQSIKKDE